MKVVFASNNAGKIQELESLLNDFELDIIPQQELNVTEIPETATTFVENALLKARHAAKITNMPAIADDSGLCVAVLHGAPGVYSARYAGEKATSAANIQKLLHELDNVDDENRDAFFYCALVFVKNAEDPTPLICDARWHGKILTHARGEKGFGYDPIFYDEHEKATAAELPLAIKNKISHRGQALRLLVEKLSHVRTFS